MTSNRPVTVYGAYGHTGRFVVDELCRRGWAPILSGRDAGKLDALAATYPALQRRVAAIDAADALDRAVEGAVAVINCAGPFLDTAEPVIEAALRSGASYLDVTAEQQAVVQVFEQFAQTARDAGCVVLPAMGFFGGLADLLVTRAMGDWPSGESVDVAVALDSWHPTTGTRLTGRRNHFSRQVVSNGRLDVLPSPAPTRNWTFPAPFGTQAMVELPFSETITISAHLHIRELHSHINLAALDDVRDPNTPPPASADASRRSSQRFAMEVVVRNGAQARRASASGRDIYAITAPLVVEAMERIVAGRSRASGVTTAGEAFDAADFLDTLQPTYLQLA